MMLGIRHYGDPVLRKSARPVDAVDDAVRRTVQDMIQTMRAERGVGLAAEQVGSTDSVCVVEVPPELDVDEEGNRLHPELEMPLALINPEILSSSGELWTAEEGCLSFPGLAAPIKRPCAVRVRYLDTDGQTHEQDLRGFVARVAQHEIDHLNGVLFIDRMSQVKRVAVAGRLRRMRRETQQELGIPA